MGAACATYDPDAEAEAEHVSKYIENSGAGDDGDLARLNTRAWLNDLSPAILALADEQAKEDRFKSLVPTENIVENLEWKIKYHKTLGSGATCRVILASLRSPNELYKRANEKKNNDNDDNNDSKNKNKNKNNSKSPKKDENGYVELRQEAITDKSALFALKQLRKDDQDNINSFQREATLLSKLDHPNVVSLTTCYIDKYNFYIATKFCSGGPMLDFIVKCKHFSEQQASYYIKSILETMAYCHSKNIVHRDLKPENIMFDKKPVLYNDPNKIGFANGAKLIIIDFGEAKMVEENKIYDEFVGTMMYLPPEITRFRHGWELKLGDAWSIGVIGYILLTGKPPFLGRDVKDTIRLIGTKPLRWPNPKKIPLSTNCKTFINRLLSKVPRYRATIAQALEHPWIVDNKNNPNVGAANLISSELLTNIADFHHAEMSKADKMLLVRGFRALDTDGNGVVTKDEVFKYLRNTGMTPKDAKRKTEEMMKSMDPTGKGEISLRDYVRAKTLSQIETQVGSEEEIVSKGLEYLDPKHTGQIDEKLLEKEVGRSMSQTEKDEFMKSIKNKTHSKTGKIDVDAVVSIGSRSNSSADLEMTGQNKKHGIITPDNHGGSSPSSSGSSSSSNSSNSSRSSKSPRLPSSPDFAQKNGNSSSNNNEDSESDIDYDKLRKKHAKKKSNNNNSNNNDTGKGLNAPDGHEADPTLEFDLDGLLNDLHDSEEEEN